MDVITVIIIILLLLFAVIIRIWDNHFEMKRNHQTLTYILFGIRELFKSTEKRRQ